MNKAYTRINWENEPNISTPLNASNLNRMDAGLNEVDNRVVTFDTTKADQSDLLQDIKTVTYDPTTGIFIFTHQNGSTDTFDLNIEKIPVSFSMDANGVITMETDDGTKYTADVGALIKLYTFNDSDIIDFTTTTDQSGNKTITATIKDGSVTADKLQPNFLADCLAAKSGAEAAETAAETSSQDAEAWAVGTRGGVPVPSTDPAYNNNAEYWAHHTSSSFAGLSDTDITNPQNGQVPVFDGTTGKWENADQSAGGGSKIIVTTSESSLVGEDVTITDGVTTITSTFDNNGVATFEGVTMTGNLTITATDGSQTATRTLTVPYFGNYTATMAFFSATITVTFPTGATCTLSDGTTTLIATSNPMAFNVSNTGTWTATATIDGISKSGTPITITTDGQTASDTIEFGTINLTFVNEFRGATITCVKDGVTITKTAPSSGNTMVFYPPTTGTWVISGQYSGQTYQTSATITSLSTAVSATLQTIPDGSTVTPTDDIQIWLNCAGIFDKTSYTTLSEVLNDSTTLLALMSDNNAVDYLVRSKTWASDVCANSTAMTDIGANNYCANTLLADSDWCMAICNSTYFESVLNVKVPTMTSATTPSGQVIGNNKQTGEFWLMFDGVIDSAGSTNRLNLYAVSKATDPTEQNSYVGYTFTSSVKIKKIKTISSENNGYPCSTIILKGSNDGGSTFVTIGTYNVDKTLITKNVIINNDTAYSSYFINVDATNKLVGFTEIQFYGRADV